jgi:hypothetical protein
MSRDPATVDFGGTSLSVEALRLDIGRFVERFRAVCSAEIETGAGFAETRIQRPAARYSVLLVLAAMEAGKNGHASPCLLVGRSQGTVRGRPLWNLRRWGPRNRKLRTCIDLACLICSRMHSRKQRLCRTGRVSVCSFRAVPDSTSESASTQDPAHET